ncbi:copia protein [Tanacetum coccineum]
MTIIGTKWVFRNKLDENGVVSRNKARLVAQCYNQQEGVNYDETYALVTRLESIRILLAYDCALDFKLFQMDVKSAFLNGFINEEVYVAQPPGFIDFEKPDHVYKLKKALYVLKQTPKAMEKTQFKPKELLPYGMILTRLFKHVMSVSPKLAFDHYLSHDRAMHPLAPHYKRMTRADRGTKRPHESNASSSSTQNHPSSSHPLDHMVEENDDESFHSNSSSPSQQVSSSSNVASRVR